MLLLLRSSPSVLSTISAVSRISGISAVPALPPFGGERLLLLSSQGTASAATAAKPKSAGNYRASHHHDDSLRSDCWQRLTRNAVVFSDHVGFAGDAAAICAQGLHRRIALRSSCKLEGACAALFTVCGRLAQLVRAPALQAGGRRFESCTAHHLRRGVFFQITLLPIRLRSAFWISAQR